MPAMDHIKEVFKLVQETGDRCVVLRDGFPPFVVMDVSSYRELLQAAARREDVTRLTEEELLDKINREIAEWRSSQKKEFEEFDLSQFRVDARTRKPEPPSLTIQQTGQKPAPAYTATNVPLPVVPDKAAVEEYALEPLS